MCGPKGEQLRHTAGPTGTPGWGSPGWPPSRRFARLTWPFRLADHDPTCRWRRFVEAVRRVTWAGWSA